MPTGNQTGNAFFETSKTSRKEPEAKKGSWTRLPMAEGYPQIVEVPLSIASCFDGEQVVTIGADHLGDGCLGGKGDIGASNQGRFDLVDLFFGDLQRVGIEANPLLFGADVILSGVGLSAFFET